MTKAYIKGSGACFPKNELDNYYFQDYLDTSDAWIKKRTGIEKRFVSDYVHACADLGLLASLQAFEGAGVNPQSLDGIVVATTTPDQVFPSVACSIQDKLGVNNNCMAFDVSAACSGFLYVLEIAKRFVESGAYKNILVVGVDILTRYLDWTDRGTCILFGDGAGACIVSSEETKKESRGPILSLKDVRLSADGTSGNRLKLFASLGGQICMKGKDVFRHAVKEMTHLVEKIMEDHQISMEQIKLLVPHQANIRILHQVGEMLHLSKEDLTSKLYTNVDRLGNTSAASIPIALDEIIKRVSLEKGDHIISVAFGAGYTSAVSLMEKVN